MDQAVAINQKQIVSAVEAKALRDQALLSTLFFTGCRVSEICSLRVKGFYEEQGFYVIDFWVKGGYKGINPSRKLSRRTIDHLFNKYTNQTGIAGITPHSARATFITQALENNCPIEVVQKTVGHSQIKTTQMYDKRVAKYRESASFAVRY